MFIKVIAWIILTKGIVSALCYLKNTITDKDSISRFVNLLIGLPLGIIDAYLAYYILFIK